MFSFTLIHNLFYRGADLLAINANGNMPYDLCEDVTTLDYIESEMTRQGNFRLLLPNYSHTRLALSN